MSYQAEETVQSIKSADEMQVAMAAASYLLTTKGIDVAECKDKVGGVEVFSLYLMTPDGYFCKLNCVHSGVRTDIPVPHVNIVFPSFEVNRGDQKYLLAMYKLVQMVEEYTGKSGINILTSGDAGSKKHAKEEFLLQRLGFQKVKGSGWVKKIEKS